MFSRGYRIDGLGFQTPMGESDFFFFFTPVFPCPPPSLLYYVYRGYFLGVKQPDHGDNHPSHLALKLGMGRAMPQLPHYACVA